jgi:zinc transport system ATP-binding protein
LCLLRLRDVSLGYGNRPVLEHVNLELARGEFQALLGPNGAGKTTLLRGIVGLLGAMAGSIEFELDRHASPLGYVPQRETLDPAFPLTVFEVVLMGTYARLPAWRRAGARQHGMARHALELVGLPALAEHRFADLSGGQTQRVLIARALAAEPSLLVLDEPTAGIDADATAAIMGVLSRLNRENGLTVLLVTHQVRMLQGIVNAVVWVQDGRAVRAGLEETLARHALAAVL